MSYTVEHPAGVAELLGVGKPTHLVTRGVRREVFCGKGKKKHRKGNWDFLNMLRLRKELGAKEGEGRGEIRAKKLRYSHSAPKHLRSKGLT